MDKVALLEYALTTLVVLAQLRCFLITRDKSLELAGVFPESDPIARVRIAPTGNDADIPDGRERIESAGGPVSPAFGRILAATNSYLDKNAGAPADFRILQDIAERVSGAIEQAATANATLPLYIGLMGTFMGVIVGLVSIAFEPSSSISDPDLKRFLGGVLVAMSASLCGLLLSVLGRGYHLHRARVRNDSSKNAYFTFLQTELLPVVGNDVSQTLKTLQSNLHKFNTDFGANLTHFTQVMGAVSDTVEQQKELLKTIKSADLIRIISTNIEMLTKLGAVAVPLRQFVDATQRLEKRVDAGAGVADKLNAVLDRITTFENSLNGLGEKLSTDDTVTMKTVALIHAQLDTLRSRNEIVTQYAQEQDEEVKRYLTAQRAKLTELTEQAGQQLSVLADEVARTVAKAFGADRARELVDSLLHLQGIHDDVRKIEVGFHDVSGSREQRRIVALLSEIARSVEPGPGIMTRILRAMRNVIKPNAES